MVQARDDGGGGSCSIAKLCPTLCDPMENLNELFGQPNINRGFLGSSAVKNMPAMQETCRKHGLDPWVRTRLKRLSSSSSRGSVI